MKVSPSFAAKELKKRSKASQSALNLDLKKFLFKKQLDFVQDPAPFKVAVCSRRSGKTVSCAAHLIHAAINNAGVNCLYITLSRSNAKKIIWKELIKINKDYQLGGVCNLTELSITFPNTSVIYCSGAKDESEIDKFRGISDLLLCYIDESQSFKSYIEDLIDDVISPALIDRAGTLCLIGTPSPLPSGFFYNCSKNPEWSSHHWTFWDNPFIAQKSKTTHQELLNRELKRRGVTANDPSIQREWYGKFVLDTDSLILNYDPSKSDYVTMPTGQQWNYILGVDIGFNDADALAVLAWSPSGPETYLVEELVTKQQDLTSLVQQIQMVMSHYDISKIVLDEGGLGKKIGEEIRKRHHIPVCAADKVRKMENYALLNDALRTGRFKAKRDSVFAHDADLVEIDWEKSTPDKRVLKKAFHSDIIDSVLYAFKESPAYAYQPPTIKAQIGTPEWANQEVSEMEQAAIDYFTRLEEEDDWNY